MSRPSAANIVSEITTRQVVRRPSGSAAGSSSSSRHEVHRGQAHVGVLRRVVHAVVVVPERAGLLVVRVLVVLDLPGHGDVAGVPVVLRQRGRAVQVDRRPRLVAPLRVLGRQVVAHGEAERRAAAGEDRRAGCDAVVAEDRGLDAGKDHGVLHLLRDGDRPAAPAVDDRRHRERQRVGPRDLLLRDLGRGLRPHDPLEGQGDRRRPQRRHPQHVPARHCWRCHGLPYISALLSMTRVVDRRGADEPSVGGGRAPNLRGWAHACPADQRRSGARRRSAGGVTAGSTVRAHGRRWCPRRRSE